jgi:CBS domain-containing protein
MSAGRLCKRILATAKPAETIWDAARRMAQYDVGSLVVLDAKEGDQAVGIITDRDIAVRCVADSLDPRETHVSHIMTTPVQTINHRTPIEDAIDRMAKASTRRLVVTGDDERVVGILSMDDVLELLVEETAAIGRLLEQQRPHVPVWG